MCRRISKMSGWISAWGLASLSVIISVFCNRTASSIDTKLLSCICISSIWTFSFHISTKSCWTICPIIGVAYWYTYSSCCTILSIIRRRTLRNTRSIRIKLISIISWRTCSLTQMINWISPIATRACSGTFKFCWIWVFISIISIRTCWNTEFGYYIWECCRWLCAWSDTISIRC